MEKILKSIAKELASIGKELERRNKIVLDEQRLKRKTKQVESDSRD